MLFFAVNGKKNETTSFSTRLLVYLQANIFRISIMDYQAIIDKYYPEDNEQKRILVKHSRMVADFSLELARRHPELGLDMAFIEEAAMLHDIGIFSTSAPDIGCTGDMPYICHGFLGAELLRKEGFPQHARVCERHTGTGLTKERIVESEWPLPQRDMSPETTAEQLICFADKFFSKVKYLHKSRTFEQVEESMARISPESVAKVREWAALFL